MTSKIILKKSNVAAKVPLVADLEYGEIALNYTDGKLWYKTAINTIAQLNSDNSFKTGTVTLDFGNYPGSNEASVTVEGQTTITATSNVILSVKSDSTSLDHTANDHSYFTTFVQLLSSTPTSGTGFTISARSHQKLTGRWTLNWAWI